MVYNFGCRHSRLSAKHDHQKCEARPPKHLYMHHINRCCFRTRRSCRRKRPVIRRRYLVKPVLQQIQQGFSAILIIHTTINTFKTSKTKTAKTPKIIKTKRINQTRMPTAYFFTSPNNKTATKNSTNRTYYYYFIRSHK